MLQKYWACHEKVEPRHTNSWNCYAKWPLLSNTSMTWNLQTFHRFSIRGLKHQPQKAWNPCACYAKSIVTDPLQTHPACHDFATLTNSPAARNAIQTSKDATRPAVFNDFGFRIAFAPQRGANFAGLNFKRCADHAMLYFTILTW